MWQFIRLNAGSCGIKPKPVLACNKAAEIADQTTVRDQRAFGISGRSTGVNQHGCIVSPRCHSGVCGTCALPQLGGGRKYCAQQGCLRLDQFHVVERVRIAQRQDGFTIVQAKSQCIRPEQHGQRHGHRAHLQDRDIRDRRRKTLRHDDCNPVTLDNAVAAQNMGQLIGGALQLPVGVLSRATLRRVFSDHDPAGKGASCPTAATHFSHIEVVWDIPVKAAMPSNIGWVHARL